MQTASCRYHLAVTTTTDHVPALILFLRINRSRTSQLAVLRSPQLAMVPYVLGDRSLLWSRSAFLDLASLLLSSASVISAVFDAPRQCALGVESAAREQGGRGASPRSVLRGA